VILKALDLMLFEEPERLTEKEVKDMKQSVGDYFHSRKDKFMALYEL
jgi:hypothetical protein